MRASLLFSTLLLAFTAHADISILDCNGRLRANKELPTGKSTSMEVHVQNAQGVPSDGTVVKLESPGKEALHAIASDGSVTFSDVPEGVWTMTTDEPGLYFSTVSFNPIIPPAYALSAGTASAAGGAAAAAGAGMAAANAVGSNSSSRSSNNPGDGDDSGNTPAEPTPTICSTCNPEAEPPTAPPFEKRTGPLVLKLSPSYIEARDKVLSSPHTSGSQDIVIQTVKPSSLPLNTTGMGRQYSLSRDGTKMLRWQASNSTVARPNLAKGKPAAAVNRH